MALPPPGNSHALEAAGSSQDIAAWLLDVRVRAMGRREHAASAPPRPRRWAWVVAIGVHLILLVALREAMQSGRPGATPDSVLYVDLVDSQPDEPPLPQPERRLPPFPRVPRARVATPTAPTVAPAIAEEATPASPPQDSGLRLFNPDGSALVPDDLAAGIARDAPQADFVPRQFAPSPLMKAPRPLKVRPNHFAQSWSQTESKALPERFFDKVTVVREFRAPWGGHWACAMILILVACGDVPDKPWTPPTRWKPATELDEQ